VRGSGVARAGSRGRGALRRATSLGYDGGADNAQRRRGKTGRRENWRMHRGGRIVVKGGKKRDWKEGKCGFGAWEALWGGPPRAEVKLRTTQLRLYTRHHCTPRYTSAPHVDTGASPIKE
jgi:hypothetical protein